MLPHSLSSRTACLHRLLALLALLGMLAGCKIGLYLDLSEPEADQMVQALAADGIPVAKARVPDGQWEVQVDRRDLGASLDLLRAHGLPAVRYGSDGPAYDGLRRRMGLSSAEEQGLSAVYLASQQVSRDVMRLDGVLRARVHVVVLARDPLVDQLRPSSAAVLVTHRPGADLHRLVPAVRALVAQRIGGLASEKVALSLLQGAVPEQDGAAGGRWGIASAFSSGALTWLLLLLPVATLCLLWWPQGLRRHSLGK
ncbi:EscJ/YscJ/HrcJ family type III secretion inner membrane ring protein [Aquabacterium sp. A7-Y]|uniref:EscJ/YscJ/HrcJ family type III secretion inner membrane ring protein n=1 Tax=Aquabacterium sp. A7-Y TaxID=1349605 RepID=UPI00223C9E5B|nr:EscJ/YscJ/HrcJ family type III secretion inner membrane ring protein [Aquabacterium sp. A7-Y]MCW7537832.1 EscJ/YscJ/HrcJ family type III secretion inner membrane ring protein [Aquabacterium sp. A7-Y]